MRDIFIKVILLYVNLACPSYHFACSKRSGLLTSFLNFISQTYQ